MKKLLAIVLALALCLGMVTMATAETTKYKIGVLVPAVTHGWVGGITYNAEQYCKELEAAGTIEYKLLTSSNAEEMTAQFDEVILWGRSGHRGCSPVDRHGSGCPETPSTRASPSWPSIWTSPPRASTR